MRKILSSFIFIFDYKILLYCRCSSSKVFHMYMFFCCTNQRKPWIFGKTSSILRNHRDLTFLLFSTINDTGPQLKPLFSSVTPQTFQLLEVLCIVIYFKKTLEGLGVSDRISTLRLPFLRKVFAPVFLVLYDPGADMDICQHEKE